MNVREQVEVVERNKDGTLTSPAVLWIISACERKSWLKKKWKNWCELKEHGTAVVEEILCYYSLLFLHQYYFTRRALNNWIKKV